MVVFVQSDVGFVVAEVGLALEETGLLAVAFVFAKVLGVVERFWRG